MAKLTKEMVMAVIRDSITATMLAHMSADRLNGSISTLVIRPEDVPKVSDVLARGASATLTLLLELE